MQESDIEVIGLAAPSSETRTRVPHTPTQSLTAIVVERDEEVPLQVDMAPGKKRSDKFFNREPFLCCGQ